MLALKPELDRFLDRFAPLFGRDENQAHARRFIQGLLHGGERRNAEKIAQAMSGGPVRSLQAFITTGTWHDGAVLDELRQAALEGLDDDDAVRNSDEAGFPKKGTKSVGVKRQYSGTPGRTDNRQVAVFADYCSAKGHTFMDRRLFLPEAWADDRDRREEAGVPPGVIFRTKPQPAPEMVAAATAAGVPFRRVGGDGVDGDRPAFVQGVRLPDKWYVLDSSADARIGTAGPRAVAPEVRPKPRRGRPCTRPLVVGEARRVDEVVAALPANAWRRLTAAEGGRGPGAYEYAEVRVWFSQEGLPGPRERLLVRRSPGQEPELKYHRSNALAGVPPLKLARVRATRWTIEEDIESGKGRCGLDEDETRAGPVGATTRRCRFSRSRSWCYSGRDRGGKRAGDDRARGAGAAGPPARGARPGRGRDPEVVGLASGEESPSGGRPSQAASRRAKTTPAK